MSFPFLPQEAKDIERSQFEDANDGLTPEQRAKIRALVDAADDGGAEDATLDETVLKKLVLAFEKKALKNQVRECQ